MSEDHPAKLDDPEIIDRIAAYQLLDPVERKAARRELLSDYAELGEQLAACLDGLELLDGIAPVAPIDLNGPKTELPRDELGDFEIIRELGRGGMGVVYEARQRSLGRLVALKVLPFAAFLDPRRLQRFKQEAQAAASLRHPNIVSVHCVGKERGVHFYAMELVEGMSVAEVLQNLRGKTSYGHLPDRQPTRKQEANLSIIDATSRETKTIAELSTQRSSDRSAFFRRIASLGAEVADALQYAHDQGVIHRDIKPSNLLLDENGKPWVTDFGLAQIQQTDGATSFSGDILGTLRYMSPEQAAGKKLLDGRTDVYSLGVTLFELLTLRPAIEGEERQQLLRRLEDSQVPSPRRVDAQIPIDLETILLKAMSHGCEERYETAADLAADLRNFLANRPISARRTSKLHRVARWMQRHSLVSGLVSTLFLVILTLAIAGPLFAIRFKQLAEEAERSANQSTRTTAALLDLLDASVAITFQALENTPTNSVVNPKLVTNTVDRYEETLAIDPTNTALMYSVAHAYDQLLFPARGRFDMSIDGEIVEAMADRALELFERLLSNDPTNVRYRRGLASVLSTRGDVLFGRDPATSIASYRRAIDIQAALVRQFPSNWEYQSDLASWMLFAEGRLRRNGQTHEANELLAEAEEQFRQLAQRVPNDDNRCCLAFTLQTKAKMEAWNEHRLAVAEATLRDALALYAQGFDDSKISTRWQIGKLAADVTLGRVLYFQGRLDDAEQRLEQAASRLAELHRQFPEHSWPLFELKTSLLALTRVQIAENDLESADRASKRLMSYVVRSRDAPLASRALAEYERGRVEWLTGDHEAAHERFQGLIDGDLPLDHRIKLSLYGLDPSLHDGEFALALAADDQISHRIAALYHLGRNAEAIELAPNIEPTDFAAFFLAMCFHSGGMRHEALQWYRLGCQQLSGDSIPTITTAKPEFLALRAEVERHLKID